MRSTLSTAPEIGWTARLGDGRRLLERGSTAERVAYILRTHITEGLFAPGTRLSEEEIGGELGVSRNTLREAFRLLVHERLLVYHFGRGVFVQVPTAEDVADLYRLRRILECAAIRRAREAPPQAVQAARRAVDEAEEAARGGRWLDVGTANMHFHQAVADLAGSPRVTEIMRGLLAELRLVFQAMSAPREFHEPYIAGNRQVVRLLEAGDVASAERALRAYFDAAERQLASAYPP
ncbi:MAG: GntR family transcriptional regulator [Carbonactinosporaceae bacterium]